MEYITALEVIEGKGASPSKGFVKLPVDLNKGAGGKYLYLCYKKEESETGIVDIQIVNGKGAGTPSGYIKCPKDLNGGAGGDYLYLAYRIGNAPESSRFGFTEINVIDHGKDEIRSAPDGYCLKEYDLNKGAGGNYIYITYKNALSMTMCNWMKALPDGTKLIDISIPGTHDTMSYKFSGGSKLLDPEAKTQNHNLDAQLKVGSRYFDIRFNDSLQCCHNKVVCYYNLEYAMDTIANFLRKNPSETILIRLGGNPGKNVNAFETLMEKYQEFYWKNTEQKEINELTLGELRGKIVILSGVDGSNYFLNQRLGFSYSDQNLKKQDDYKDPKVEQKFKEIKELIEDKNESQLKLNHVSAVGQVNILIWTPEKFADNLNPLVEEYLRDNRELEKIGVIIFDFINENLSWAVVRHNFV